MFDGLTWGAILEQWPFGAAAAVLVIAVGMLIAVRPKSNAPKTTYTVADGKDWRLTGWNRVCRSSASHGACARSGGIQTPLAQLAPSTTKFVGEGDASEAKMISEANHAQRKLAIPPSLTDSTPAGTQRKENGQGERIDTELGDVANRRTCRRDTNLASTPFGAVPRVQAFT